MRMAFKHFQVAALALVLVCSEPVESERDQYENIQNEARRAVSPLSEATDPVLQVIAARRSGSVQKERDADADSSRAKRGYSRWAGQAQLPGYERLTMWKPPVYQLSRPYFIPVYGAPGRVPIYFPPQKLNLNPGAPVDNPLPSSYQGPVYLPPKEYLPATTTKKPMEVGYRYEDEDDDDDRPIWGISVPSTEKPSNIIPTRPPRPPSSPDFPPLVHNANKGTNFLSVDESSNQRQPVRVTTPKPVSGPTNCAWAIVSCCSAASSVVPDSCFEQRGCPGPFWGASPCESDYARAAVQSALNHFG